MATDADAAAAGFSMPQGTSPISGGDDAIRQNARRALELIEDAKFLGDPAEAGGDLDDLTEPGLHSYWSDWDNRPSERSGAVFVIPPPLGTGAALTQIAIPYGQFTPEMYYRFRGSVSFSPWVRFDAGAVDIPDVPASASAGPASFRTVPLALTVGGSQAAGATSGNYRMPAKFGATIRRWRIHFRNINPRFGTDGPAASISAVHAGPATDGQFTGAPQQIATGLTTGSNGTATAWQTTPIPAGTEWAIAYSFTASSTNQVIGGGWSASHVSSTDATLTRVTNLPLDAWIEAEVAPEVPIIAVFGDSLSSGVGATLPVFDSWLSQWARTAGALPVHYSASGDTMAGWDDSTSYKWVRWQHLSRPDAVVHAMGSNDVFNGTGLATMQTRRAHSLEQLAQLVSPNIVSVTLLPRDADTGALEQVRRDYNTIVKRRADSRDVFDFVPAVSGNDETISPGFNADGTHLNTAGYGALAGTITRPLASNALASLAYDSGPRNVSQQLLSTFMSATSNATLQRTGTRVEFNLYVRQFDRADAPTGTVLFTLPVGYRPRATYRVGTVAPSNGQITVSTNGTVTLHVGEIPLNSYVTFNFSHTTGDPTPTS